MIIYKATNKKTGKSYIGQTIRGIKRRRSEHLRYAQQIERQKYPTPFHSAIREHGAGSFTWEVLEECSSQDHMNERECFYIKLLGTQVPNGYNQTIGGHMTGDMCEEIRDKIAESMRQTHQDPEYRARVYPKLKDLVAHNKGKTISEEQKAKISEALKAVHADPEYINPNLGTTRTEEQKANIRAGQEGNMATGEAWHEAHDGQYTVEVRAKMRAAKVGKKPANTIKIQCVESGVIYAGLTDAAKGENAPRQSIWLQLKGKLRSAGGKTFRYLK